MGAFEDFKAALVAAWSPGRVYEIGSVPASPAYPYVVLSDDPDAPLVRSLDGSGDLAGRMTVQVFGDRARPVRDLSLLIFNLWDGHPAPGKGSVASCDMLSPVFRDPDTNGVLGRTLSFRF